MAVVEPQLRDGQIAARIDRLPLTNIQWRLSFITQLLWGVVISLDGMEQVLYPFVWAPKHYFSPLQYSLLVGFQVGGGVLIGEYLLGFVADRYGRKKVMIASCLIVSLLFWPTAFLTNWWLLMLFFTAGSLGIGGVLATNVVYMAEMAPPQVRGRVMQGTQVLAGFLVVLLAVVPALFLIPTHYKAYVFLLCAIPVVVVLPFLIFGLPESPRWLEARGRRVEAERILSDIEAKIVRKHGALPPIDLNRHQVLVTEKVPTREIFTGRYRGQTILLLICWVLGYAGVDYGVSSYSTVYLVANGMSAHEVFLAAAISGFAGAILAPLIGSILGERVERKTLVLFSGIICALGALGYFFFPKSFMMIAIAGALLIAARMAWVFNMYNYTAAAYPTRLRSVGTGWTDGVGHIGAVFGPVVAGVFYASTASTNHIGWFVWCVIPGSLLPSFLVYKWGMRQREAVLEEVAP
ncbi:MFS transporter [Alicyclobacillus cycloheptanicus]|uniref:MFS transporter n=1 Tax=Alicyclobacillus cycloheptanicus TaxID=1457 RepID=A0ABT9XMF3_9BACL|nr:MFS transporter [Alicyclobacillus cycloheptanicus]MDQ0191501.1 putative MFS transporter [Alicyclobacillus cycloheptanicus]WDL99996.1 MFS transporter [Alicyclobacillus cycloheptanicus]